MTINIDEAIEAHLRAFVAEAYPALTDDNVVVRIDSGDFKKETMYRDESLGEETAEVQLAIRSDDKLDRHALIRLVSAVEDEIDLAGANATREYYRFEAKDYIEAIGTKGLVFYFRFIYDLAPLAG